MSSAAAASRGGAAASPAQEQQPPPPPPVPDWQPTGTIKRGSQLGKLGTKRAARDIALLRREGNALCELVRGGGVGGCDDMRRLVVRMRGADGTPYAGEFYFLQFELDVNYPLTPPTVVFIGASPAHEHVYSNGHICLSIIYSPGWAASMTLQSVVLSVVSMLSSAHKKQRPANDLSYRRSDPRSANWVFDDDRC